jgi:hypothetical protein
MKRMANEQATKVPEPGNVDILKPDEQKKEIQKPKKRHGLRNFFIVFLIIVVAIVIAIGATGVYRVPVVSSVFGFNKPKDLGIKSSPEALASVKQKIPLVITGTAVDYSSSPDKIFSGTMPVDTQVTSEEVTSWLNRFKGTNSPFTDIQVRKIEGGLEISTLVNKYIKAPVYVKVMINRTGEKSISLDIAKAKVGAFNVPAKYLTQAQDWFQKKINERMAVIPGFSMTTYEIHNGYSVMKGTWPKTVGSNQDGWSALVGL